MLNTTPILDLLVRFTPDIIPNPRTFVKMRNTPQTRPTSLSTSSDPGVF